ncbi:MAG: ribosomal RNA small subunit methyltransferase A [Verrucomicrobia bacterium]|nr:ribosomal RNA small subunit methyltransferase A [Verrucomicrobiota bacterium]
MTIAQIIATLETLGAAPRKSLGQNFLHDANLARWIVNRLDLGPGDHVLEIGPGLGALTEEILAEGVSATLLERDRLFNQFLQNRFRDQRCQVISGDALEYDCRDLFIQESVKAVGNLPYYISTPLLFHFTAEPCPFRKLVFTVQREVADRLVASHGTKAYGILSVVLQARWRITCPRVLPSSVFFPRPQVDSAVVELVPRIGPDALIIPWDTFQLAVRTGFGARRKQLRGRLATAFDGARVNAAFDKLNLRPDARAEDLSLEAWVDLASYLEPVPPAQSSAEEQLQVVDDADQPLAGANRDEVHSRGLLHRAVHIFIFNERGELFLQKRSHRKDRFPGCWDSSAAGHVDVGETYERCAYRELGEELELETALELIGKIDASSRTGYEFIRLYAGSANGPFRLNRGEIETGGFFQPDTLDRWLEQRPADFAPGFHECYELFRRVSQDPRK